MPSGILVDSATPELLEGEEREFVLVAPHTFKPGNTLAV